MPVLLGNVNFGSRRYMAVDGLAGGLLQPYINAMQPSTRLYRGSTSPTAPLLPLTKPYTIGYVSSVYALNTLALDTGYIDGQYTLALVIYISVTSSLTVDDSLSYGLDIPITIASALSVDDNAAATLVIPVSMPSTVTVDDNMATQMTLNITLPSGIELLDRLYSTSFGQKGYVMNVNTGAVSVYDGWNFNSMAKVGQSYYAAGPAGLVKLTGDTDVGTQIDASVKTGITDFDSTRMKRMVKAYLGVSSDGQVYLKTITEDGNENLYELQAETSNVVKESPVEIGRGLRARYWQFEVLNDAGSDFTLESVEFYPVILQRHY